MIKNLLLFGLLISFTYVQGQKLQVGIGASSSLTFFQKGQSTYNDNYFEARPRLGLGLSIPAYFKFSDHFALSTGIGFQHKQYHFEQNRYDFPNVVNGSGAFNFQVKYTALEIPLIISFSPGYKDNNYKIEYKIGCVLSSNRPYTTSTDVQEFEYIGNDTVYYNFGVGPNWSRYYSPDIYIGIGLIKNKETRRQHEITISYQYSFTQSTKYQFSSELSNSQLTKGYNATLTPNLSYIALTYVFFPRWLNFMLEKDEDENNDN